MKKGFTLIELLAVIVILAIVSVIAVPIMLNVIDKAKQGTAESSALGYIDAVEKQVMINKVKSGNEIEPGEYTKSELTAKGLTIKGEVEDAVVVINEKGKVSEARFYIDGYSLDYDGKKIITNKEVDYSSGIESILNSCPISVGTEYTFDYTGDYQEFKALCDGYYQVELWGAQGNGNSTYPGGYGGYTKGKIQLSTNTELYVYVGEMPTDRVGGYNGGGGACYGDRRSSTYQNTNGGGGATDIRYFTTTPSSTDLVWNSEIGLKSRIMVAGAGGGAYSFNTQYSNQPGGNAGGLSSYGTSGAYKSTTAATQINPGKNNNPITIITTDSGSGTLGVGGDNEVTKACIDGRGTCHTVCGGGGSGYYGGGAGLDYGTPGSGGSSYISGHNGCDAISETSTLSNIVHTGQANHYSGLYFTDTLMVDGAGYEWTTVKASSATGMPTHDGTSTMNGNTGNGYAKITYLGK